MPVTTVLRMPRSGSWRLNGKIVHQNVEGIGLGIGLQALINIGVNVGLFPTKGLTLPFLSYGSNSLIVACMAAGLLLRIDSELRRSDAGRDPLRGMKWARA